MNHDHAERPAAWTAPPRTARVDPLAQLKRASLRNEALRAAWQLGALVRRVEQEAPEVHRRLRCAVEALQLLSAKLALAEGEGARTPAAAGGGGPGRPGGEAGRGEGPPPPAELEGEIF